MEFEEMKDRIAHIIRAKNLTAAEFAIQLGIQPSNVSHLLSGRNNPSLDFVKKLKETFPEYNLDWIVFGKGPMTLSEPYLELKQDTIPASESVSDEGTLFAEALFDPGKRPIEAAGPVSVSSSPVMKHIILVYSDNSFEVLSPR